MTLRYIVGCYLLRFCIIRSKISNKLPQAQINARTAPKSNFPVYGFQSPLSDFAQGFQSSISKSRHGFLFSESDCCKIRSQNSKIALWSLKNKIEKSLNFSSKSQKIASLGMTRVQRSLMGSIKPLRLWPTRSGRQISEKRRSRETVCAFESGLGVDSGADFHVGHVDAATE